MESEIDDTTGLDKDRLSQVTEQSNRARRQRGLNVGERRPLCKTAAMWQDGGDEAKTAMGMQVGDEAKWRGKVGEASRR